jgi:L-amino acid N-acyltransferase YncA
LADAEGIAAIYNVEVLESTATFDLTPRTLQQQRTWQIERSGAHAVLVAIDDASELAGFASLSPFRARPAYSTTVESSVYVSREHRRRGIARLLMIELIATAKSHGFHSVIARIADSQEASLALHAEMGFDFVGVEREIGRKFGRWLDVSVMQVLL